MARELSKGNRATARLCISFYLSFWILPLVIISYEAMAGIN